MVWSTPFPGGGTLHALGRERKLNTDSARTDRRVCPGGATSRTRCQWPRECVVRALTTLTHASASTCPPASSYVVRQAAGQRDGTHAPSSSPRAGDDDLLRPTRSPLVQVALLVNGLAAVYLRDNLIVLEGG
ncbi:hypothetical protein E2C01_060898 [Portunus trituberculatus]|uniref:Uncharacterized protein n=1 Tax=Portunus trituberculatus TaxID=210409 RepID=A0A5B7HBT1_PORTR|nr:hypothetical protein [Portunus trituberculatus]